MTSAMDVRKNRFFEAFSITARERIVSHLIYQDLPAGEYLFREGDAAEGLCLVIDGEIEVFKTAGAREEFLAIRQPGDFLGEVAVLDGQGRSTDARAKSAASVAWIPTTDLLDVLQEE